MKKGKLILLLFAIGTLLMNCGNNEKKQVKKEGSKKHAMMQMKMANDDRISLKLNVMQKNHQLKMMRSHLAAVQNIMQLVSQNKFDEAAEVAHSQLGASAEMKMMCAIPKNKQFEDLGLQFHKSADEMGNMLKLKDKDKSLAALAKTLNYCVNCHATFKL